MGHRIVLFICNVATYVRHPRLIFRFRRRMGHFPNVAAPRTYNEKMLWRKLFDHNPVFITFCDKLQTKEYLRRCCPELSLPRTLWEGLDPREVPFHKLALPIVIKPNSRSGSSLTVRDGVMGISELAQIHQRWSRDQYGRRDLEWGYALADQKLFAEEWLELGGDDLPTDIKFHVCSGRIVHVWAVDYASGRSVTLDPQGRTLNAPAIQFASPSQVLPVSAALEDAVRRAGAFAERIGRNIDYARVDFLLSGGRIFGGEITVYPAAGYDRWTDPAISRSLAAAWDLRNSDFLQRTHGGLHGVYARSLCAHLSSTSI
jgi:hypothetical protein